VSDVQEAHRVSPSYGASERSLATRTAVSEVGSANWRAHVSVPARLPADYEHGRQAAQATPRQQREAPTEAADAVKPFDLPPDNFLDWLGLRRPAEVRERDSYLSKPPDEHRHRPHPHYEEPPPPPEPQYVPPGAQLISWPHWEEERRARFVAVMAGLLYRNRVLYAATAAPE
jgi:hypothetical protein